MKKKKKVFLCDLSLIEHKHISIKEFRYKRFESLEKQWRFPSLVSLFSFSCTSARSCHQSLQKALLRKKKKEEERRREKKKSGSESDRVNKTKQTGGDEVQR